MLDVLIEELKAKSQHTQTIMAKDGFLGIIPVHVN